MHALGPYHTPCSCLPADGGAHKQMHVPLLLLSHGCSIFVLIALRHLMIVK